MREANTLELGALGRRAAYFWVTVTGPAPSLRKLSAERVLRNVVQQPSSDVRPPPSEPTDFTLIITSIQS